MSPAELAAASAIVAVGASIQGSVGFGLNVVAAPTLALIDPALVPGPTLVIAVVLPALIARRERASMDLRGLAWAFVGRVPGTVLGVLALTRLRQRDVGIALAGVVLFAVLLSATGWHLRPARASLFGVGAVSGFMGTISSIGGPPMAMLYQRSPGVEMRANLSGFFVIGASFSIALLAASGHFGVEQVRASLALLPGVLLGFAVSKRTAPVLDRGYTRPAVLAVSTASAVALLLRYAL